MSRVAVSTINVPKTKAELLGAEHLLWADPLVKLGGLDEAQLDRGLPQRAALLVRVLRDPGRLVVADMRIQRGHQHERPVQQLRDPRAIRLDAAHAVHAEGARRVAEQPERVQHVADDERLVDVEVQLAARARDRDRHVVAHHLRGHHRVRLALRGVHFARHDARARLVFRYRELADAAARARGEQADIVSDLHKRGGHRVECAVHLHERVVRGERFEFVWRGHKREARVVGDLLSNAFRKPDAGVEAGADRRAAGGQLIEARQRGEEALLSGADLMRVRADLVAEPQRDGVLHVRAAQLDDVMKLFGFLLQRRGDLVERGRSFLEFSSCCQNAADLKQA